LRQTRLTAEAGEGERWPGLARLGLVAASASTPLHAGLAPALALAVQSAGDDVGQGVQRMSRQVGMPPKKAADDAEPCREGCMCMTLGCPYSHPRTPRCRPRKVNAQVVVMRRDIEGKLWVLLQRRGLSSAICPGRLAAVGGRRELSDSNSQSTAIREVFEETGLLDLGFSRGAPPELLRAAKDAEAKKPLAFFPFQQGGVVDWFLLLLDGDGTFVPAPHKQSNADIGPLMAAISGAVPSPAFGHAWVPVHEAVLIGDEDCYGGLAHRVQEAVACIVRRIEYVAEHEE